VTLRDAGDYITSLPKAEQCSMSDRQRSKPCSWSSSSTGHHDGAHWHTESIEPERRNATVLIPVQAAHDNEMMSPAVTE